MQPCSDFVFNLRETSGQPGVSLNAKTNGYRWERGLGCEPPSQWQYYFFSTHFVSLISG